MKKTSYYKLILKTVLKMNSSECGSVKNLKKSRWSRITSYLRRKVFCCCTKAKKENFEEENFEERNFDVENNQEENFQEQNFQEENFPTQNFQVARRRRFVFVRKFFMMRLDENFRQSAIYDAVAIILRHFENDVIHYTLTWHCGEYTVFVFSINLFWN